MPAHRQLPPVSVLLGTILLAGCESQLSVDLAVAAPSGVSKVVLNITDVDLESDDGSVDEYGTGIDNPFDVTPYSRSESFNDDDRYEGQLELINENNLSGDFVGIRPVFDTTDAYVQLSSGAQLPISLSSQASYASISLSLSDSGTSSGDSARIITTLELPFSLVKNSAGTGYEFTPVIRAVKSGNGGTISGSIPESSVTGGSCGSSAGSGVAVYVYSGSGVTPTDYYDDGSNAHSDQPLASSPLDYDSSNSEYLFEIRNLPAGSYTVAWTCKAANDAPNTSDSLGFLDTVNATVAAGSTTTISFD